MEPWAILLADRVKTGGVTQSRIGLFIREYLLHHGEGNPYGIFVGYREMLESIGWKRYSYQSVRIIFYVLKQMGLVVPTRGEATGDGRFRKQFYSLDRLRLNDPAWRRPMQAYRALSSGTRTTRTSRISFPAPSRRLTLVQPTVLHNRGT